MGKGCEVTRSHAYGVGPRVGGSDENGSTLLDPDHIFKSITERKKKKKNEKQRKERTHGHSYESIAQTTVWKFTPPNHKPPWAEAGTGPGAGSPRLTLPRPYFPKVHLSSAPDGSWEPKALGPLLSSCGLAESTSSHFAGEKTEVSKVSDGDTYIQRMFLPF